MNKALHVKVNTLESTSGKIGLMLHLVLLSITIVSYLVLPNIQGTLISLVILPFYLAAAVFRNQMNIGKFIGEILRFLSLYLIYQVIIVTACLYSNADNWLQNSNLILVNPGEASSGFKTSTITQSIYLVSGITFFYLCKNCGDENWKRIAALGAGITAMIGIVEVFLNFVGISSSQIFHNRVFNGSEISTGSPLIQTISIGGVSLKRLDGLSLEPSMFALTTVPFLYFAYQLKMWITTLIIFLALLLSFSTTGYIGLFGFTFLLFRNRRLGSKVTRIFAYMIAFCISLISIKIVYSVFLNLFVEKFSRANISGIERTSNIENTFEFFLDRMSVFEKLFGIGFGTVRSTDFISTLLVNTGITGLLIFLLIFLRPFIGSNYGIDVYLRTSLIFLFICMLLAVPEFSFLTVWFVLGFAYRQKNQSNPTLKIGDTNV